MALPPAYVPRASWFEMRGLAAPHHEGRDFVEDNPHPEEAVVDGRLEGWLPQDRQPKLSGCDKSRDPLVTHCACAFVPAAGFAWVVGDIAALLNSEGAGKAGRWPRPWPACRKKAGGSHHRSGLTRPAFPARWFGGLYALSLGTGCLAPIVSATHTRRRETWHRHRDAR